MQKSWKMNGDGWWERVNDRSNYLSSIDWTPQTG
jgi:hypothetical protein